MLNVLLVPVIFIVVVAVVELLFTSSIFPLLNVTDPPTLNTQVPVDVRPLRLPPLTFTLPVTLIIGAPVPPFSMTVDPDTDRLPPMATVSEVVVPNDTALPLAAVKVKFPPILVKAPPKEYDAEVVELLSVKLENACPRPVNATEEPARVTVAPEDHVAVGITIAALFILTLPVADIIRLPVVLVTPLTASFILNVPDMVEALFVAL